MGPVDADKEIEVMNELAYKEPTSANRHWLQIATLFTDMYRYFAGRGLMLPVSKNGGKI